MTELLRRWVQALFIPLSGLRLPVIPAVALRGSAPRVTLGDWLITAVMARSRPKIRTELSTLTLLAGREPSAARAAVLLLSTQALTAASAFGVSLLAATVMAPAARGELALWLQIVYLSSTLALLGIERPMVAHAQGSARSVTAFVLARLASAPATLAVLSFVALVWLILSSGSQLPLLLMTALSYVLTNVQLRAVRIGYLVSRDWRPFVSITIGTHLVTIAVSLLLALLGAGDVRVWTLVYVVSGVVVLLYLGRDRDAPDVSLDVDVRELMRTSYRLIPASIGNTAMLRSDRLLLPMLSSSAQLGLYVMVATATELAAWPVQQYVDASLRKWRQQSPTIWSIHGRTAVGFGIGAGFAVLAGTLMHHIIMAWLPAYTDSLGLVPPLVLAAAIYSATRVQQGLLVSQARTGMASLVETAGMVASVLLYLALIPGLGAVGAAIGSVIGYSVGLVIGAVALSTRTVR
ncbi:lipopolysaccharide biosynthesis protein [Agrococcus sp. HG114]|uniref:lipopolysaccharide biosynthesis protein n=1 Tax=Agrococcus sp. HG114 TaxID=2969757 RepID=UPI00215A7E3C|nr:hypothetical protein [Agrococcus sp. HG114]MCR8669849.1 hypothetical protein [Agrococcus sp. HG114]